MRNSRLVHDWNNVVEQLLLEKKPKRKSQKKRSKKQQESFKLNLIHCVFKIFLKADKRQKKEMIKNDTSTRNLKKKKVIELEFSASTRMSLIFSEQSWTVNEKRVLRHSNLRICCGWKLRSKKQQLLSNKQSSQRNGVDF